MRLLHRVSTCALLLFAGALQAAAPLAEQIKSELEDVLYPVAKIVPGYQRPIASAPKFAVAEFRVSSDELSSWSQAVSEILRYRIQYVPDVRLYMPAPYYTYTDAQSETGTARPLLTSHSAFQNLYTSLGIESILTGSVAFDGTEYALTTELVDTTNDSKTLQREWRFPPQDLPATLISITEWVFHSLGVELTANERAYLKDTTSLNHEAIDDFILNYAELQQLKGPLLRDKINQLQNNYPHFIVFAVYALQHRNYATNLDEAYKNLELYKSLRSLYPGNAGIALESYRAMEIESLPKHEVAARLNNMKDLVKNNPQDPSIMINFADALVKNGNSVEGISTMLEAVNRWPKYYRAWWSLGWALNKHAWQVRGNSMWRDVPEQAKDKFKILSHLANLTIDEALALNPRNGQLWSMKINSQGAIKGYSEELMAVFNKAAQLAPGESSIYDNALNFSADRWGGNIESRKHIIQLAAKNNPNEAWPVSMRNRHSSDFDGTKEGMGTSMLERYLKKIIDHPSIWEYILIFIGMALSAAYVLGRKSAKDKAGPRDDSDHY